MIFQFGELLPELTALENVALPLRLMGTARAKAEKQAAEWLDRLGLDRNELHSAHPDVLSGGEIQRVGVARALAHEPGLVLADEPTGALDEENTSLIVGLLSKAAKDLGAVVVIVTHDTMVASKADRAMQLRDGRLTLATPGLTGRAGK
jgi:putative ABC transport system ATP-binding protein